MNSHNSQFYSIKRLKQDEEKKESIPIRGSGLVGLRNLGNRFLLFGVFV